MPIFIRVFAAKKIDDGVPSVVKRQSDNYDVAKALSAALEPVIDVCLQIGIISPELESLLRATFAVMASGVFSDS